MNLFCVGLSHHRTSVETLEQYAGRSVEDSGLRACGCAEALLLATCNRVEVYAAAETVVPNEKIARCLAPGIERAAPGEAHSFYRFENGECARHLFRVASGLDSMVIGETEILGQAKKAYAAAQKSGTAGRYLHRLFQRAFRVAKQVRTHTDITRGAVSVSSVAVDLAEKIFGNLAGCKVLVLGAGEASERTVSALVAHGVTDLRVANRSTERAEKLIRVAGGRAVAFDDWLDQCRAIDILISSTASDRPLLTREKLAPLLRARVDRPLFIIDIAVPRDVDPAVNELEGVYLYDIDDLRSVAEQSLALRRGQIAAAEEIIDGHVAKFCESIGMGLSDVRDQPEHPPLGEEPLQASR